MNIGILKLISEFLEFLFLSIEIFPQFCLIKSWGGADQNIRKVLRLNLGFWNRYEGWFSDQEEKKLLVKKIRGNKNEGELYKFEFSPEMVPTELSYWCHCYCRTIVPIDLSLVSWSGIYSLSWPLRLILRAFQSDLHYMIFLRMYWKIFLTIILVKSPSPWLKFMLN